MDSTQQSFLVTGGRGFIGSRVIELLLHQNHRVFSIDDFSGHGDGISPAESLLIMSARSKLVKGAKERMFSLPAPKEKWNQVDGGIDTIIHLASTPREAVASKSPERAAITMVQGLTNVLEHAKETGVKRVVFISSSMVYGNFSGPVPEDAALAPIGIYGIFKQAGEQLVKCYADKFGFEYVIVRPTAVYGQTDMPDRVIPRFFNQALAGDALVVNGADERLDFTHVSDVANGIVLAATVDKAANRTYNISYGRAELISTAAEIITTLIGKGRVVAAEKQSHFPSRDALDISAARRDLGYNPVIPLGTGLAMQYQWLTQQLNS